uniref:Uncharacterized protein n=1 Tax=Arundo donax TaxID=35708 RepID=A0A0A9C957_ARUDO
MIYGRGASLELLGSYSECCLVSLQLYITIMISSIQFANTIHGCGSLVA